ncbi:Sulfoacetaldehyde reductase [Rhodobacteraceae bacterium THAF1]|uniref:SDR family oxidoreductase n=1 Tax=Palleronia sp. THAF1 TaxID=2587842 RepID=UPI000F3B61CB|nr:SDR family oxidoreductase [Palleronia sp. THAF1]QFU09212.1 Sulfoacetaldehyde reductase [Palleronia sp. THAF1]VDC27333.1 Sulfoacetaldehyde reductase [Rhodobacteraceae bacterium THAF1]
MSTPAPVLILGAKSGMGLACAHAFAAKGHPIQLAARDVQRLEDDRADIATRHDVPVSLHEFDALETDSMTAMLDALPDQPEIALCAVGILGEQSDAQTDMAEAARVMRSNFEGPALLLGEIANRFEARGSGRIVGISSVAGERGRKSNYVYGAAKAGFTAFLSGLRNRLTGSGVQVTTVIPGFVSTDMIAGKKTPAPLTASPQEAANAIVDGVMKGRDVIYVKGRWRLVMAVIRSLPESVFKKTDF